MGTVQFFLATFVMAAVNGAFDRDHRHPHPQCSKEWIRYLVLNACNYSKRHIAVVEYVVEESIKNIQLKFNETLKLGESSRAVLGSSRTKRTTKITSERVTFERREGNDKNRLASSASLLDSISHDLVMEIQQDEEVWKRRVRSIKTLVERCCVKLCKEEDFKVLCFV